MPGSSSAHDHFLSRSYFPALDGLRCLAISAVIFHHSTSRPLPGWLGRGHLGVQLFFAISGFLITTLLLRELRETSTIALRRFWLRRSLRIFPLYYAVLGAFALFTESSGGGPAQAQFWHNLPYFASYTCNWFVNYGVPHAVVFGFAWSLATEEQFYALWPLLIRALRRIRWVVLALLTLIVVDQLAERGRLAFLLGRHSALESVVTSFSPSIALGALFALGLEGRYARFLSRLLGHRAALPACATLAALLVARPIEPFLCFEFVLAALVAAAALRAQSPRGELLASAGLTAVGRASYGMYLFHVPVIGALRRLFPEFSGSPGALFVVALPTTFALASASYRWLEAPFLRLRSQVAAGRLVSRPALGAAATEQIALRSSVATSRRTEEPAAAFELDRARVD
ncbi:MAG TPA: acyltransferase [Polyangiaceae bacterium]|nr:acyltransferase [Polyangiaceae bacterium]